MTSSTRPPGPAPRGAPERAAPAPPAPALAPSQTHTQWRRNPPAAPLRAAPPLQLRPRDDRCLRLHPRRQPQPLRLQQHLHVQLKAQLLPRHCPETRVSAQRPQPRPLQHGQVHARRGRRVSRRRASATAGCGSGSGVQRRLWRQRLLPARPGPPPECAAPLSSLGPTTGRRPRQAHTARSRRRNGRKSPQTPLSASPLTPGGLWLR